MIIGPLALRALIAVALRGFIRGDDLRGAIILALTLLQPLLAQGLTVMMGLMVLRAGLTRGLTVGAVKSSVHRSGMRHL